MSGGKIWPLFAQVRRHAEEARANILVSLELLRREVDEIRVERAAPAQSNGQLTPKEIATLREFLAQVDKSVKQALEVKPKSAMRKVKSTNGRRKHARRKK